MTASLTALGSAKSLGQVMDAFWLCRNILEAQQFVNAYSQRTPHAEQNIRDGISMEGGKIAEIGKAWLDGDTVTFDIEDHGQFYTVCRFWDCECELDYIQPGTKIKCTKCGSYQEDQMPSRLIEVLERFGLPYEQCRFRITKFVPPAEVRAHCEAYLAAIRGGSSTPSSQESPGVVNEEDGA